MKKYNQIAVMLKRLSSWTVTAILVSVILLQVNYFFGPIELKTFFFLVILIVFFGFIQWINSQKRKCYQQCVQIEQKPFTRLREDVERKSNKPFGEFEIGYRIKNDVFSQVLVCKADNSFEVISLNWTKVKVLTSSSSALICIEIKNKDLNNKMETFNDVIVENLSLNEYQFLQEMARQMNNFNLLHILSDRELLNQLKTEKKEMVNYNYCINKAKKKKMNMVNLGLNDRLYILR